MFRRVVRASRRFARRKNTRTRSRLGGEIEASGAPANFPPFPPAQPRLRPGDVLVSPVDVKKDAVSSKKDPRSSGCVLRFARNVNPALTNHHPKPGAIDAEVPDRPPLSWPDPRSTLIGGERCLLFFVRKARAALTKNSVVVHRK